MSINNVHVDTNDQNNDHFKNPECICKKFPFTAIVYTFFATFDYVANCILLKNEGSRSLTHIGKESNDLLELLTNLGLSFASTSILTDAVPSQNQLIFLVSFKEKGKGRRQGFACTND